MKKLIVLVVVMVLAGAASAQEPAGSGGSAAGAGAPAADVGMPSRVPVPPPPPKDPAELRRVCTEAMNADPTFAKDIAAKVDLQIDQKTLDAQNDANYHIQKNQRHVIYAYAAMWIVAALFVLFLWRRQLALQTEIAQLRKDLRRGGKGGLVTGEHVLFIPGVLMVGMFLGFILGTRAARNQFDLERKREAEREALRAARAAKKTAAKEDASS